MALTFLCDDSILALWCFAVLYYCFVLLFEVFECCMVSSIVNMQGMRDCAHGNNFPLLSIIFGNK